MMRTLKAFVIAQREMRGWTQTELSRQSGVPRTTVNRIESGTTKLPEANVRRRLAKALGVRHVDLLVAAGELAPDEVEPPDESVSPAVRRLQPLIDQVPWDEAKYQTVASILRLMTDPRRETGSGA